MNRFKIGKREYTITEEQDRIVVSGTFRGSGNRLLPGIEEALVEHLSPIYPTGRYDESYEIKTYQAVFRFTPSGATRLVIPVFEEIISDDTEALALIEKASAIDRRYHLAKKCGIRLSETGMLYDPIRQIEKEWNVLTEKKWKEFSHPHKNLVSWLPRIKMKRENYEYSWDTKRPIPVKNGDAEWLNERLKEVQSNVARLIS